MKLLLGIDFGTGGCKVTAIGADGAFAGEASVEYATYHDRPGWSEQDPADWYRAMCAALAKLREKGADLAAVAAVSFDGSTHNAVLLDGAMRPVRRTIMWTDQRATAECEALRSEGARPLGECNEAPRSEGARPLGECNEALRSEGARPLGEHNEALRSEGARPLGECNEALRSEGARPLGERIFARTYQMPAPTWTLPQMMWLKAHEPEALAHTEHVLFVKDYVRYLVTGVAVTDFIEAQGTLFFDMAARTWDDGLVALSGLRREALPALVGPTDVVGSVTAQAARDTGLPEGTPVVCGTSDSAVEDYGAGAIEPGDLIVKLATAGNVNAMTAEPHPHPRTLTYSHVIPGMWYSVSATNAAALCLRWFRDTFCPASPDGSRPSSVYAQLDAEAEASPPGAGGVMFHPYLQGERCPYWDASLRASFTGVSIASQRGDFARALMEGVAFSLRDCFGTLQEMGLPAKRIFLIGGGARSRLWSEIVCNVFARPLAVPSPGDASFGTALLAGVGAGVWPDAASAVRACSHVDRTLAPDPVAVERYDALFSRYRAIHDALAPLYSKG